jgi:protein-disulfide isomerase
LPLFLPAEIVRAGTNQELEMNRKTLLAGSAVVLGAAILVGTMVYLNGSASKSAQSVDRNRPGLTQIYSPTQGNPEAKVHIVEFLDPACETCASFYPEVKKLMADNPDRVRVTLRLVPFHRGSDYAIKALEAARKQGKFGPALEALLSSQSYWAPNHTVQPDAIWTPLEGLGLNMEQLKADMNSPEIARRIEQDLNDAKTLKVTQTPEYFVNGRPLPTWGLEQLQALVKEEVQANYK